MIELKLGPLHKIRVWVGEVPNLPCEVGEYVNHSLPSSGLVVKDRQLIGVELFIRAGARSLYGFLAGEFLPMSSEALAIKVATTNKVGEVVDWALLRNIDQVFAGLPVEYGRSIVQGVIEMDAGRLLGSGVLHFNCAAHSLVGSSGDIFRRIAHLIVYLLSNQGDVSNNDKIRALLEIS